MRKAQADPFTIIVVVIGAGLIGGSLFFLALNAKTSSEVELAAGQNAKVREFDQAFNIFKNQLANVTDIKITNTVRDPGFFINKDDFANEIEMKNYIVERLQTKIDENLKNYFESPELAQIFAGSIDSIEYRDSIIRLLFKDELSPTEQASLKAETNTVFDIAYTIVATKAKGVSSDVLIKSEYRFEKDQSTPGNFEYPWDLKGIIDKIISTDTGFDSQCLNSQILKIYDEEENKYMFYYRNYVDPITHQMETEVFKEEPLHINLLCPLAIEITEPPKTYDTDGNEIPTELEIIRGSSVRVKARVTGISSSQPPPEISFCDQDSCSDWSSMSFDTTEELYYYDWTPEQQGENTITVRVYREYDEITVTDSLTVGVIFLYYPCTGLSICDPCASVDGGENDGICAYDDDENLVCTTGEVVVDGTSCYDSCNNNLISYIKGLPCDTSSTDGLNLNGICVDGFSEGIRVKRCDNAGVCDDSIESLYYEDCDYCEEGDPCDSLIEGEPPAFLEDGNCQSGECITFTTTSTTTSSTTTSSTTTSSTTSTTSTGSTTTSVLVHCCHCSDGSWMCTENEFDCSDMCEGTFYADKICVGDGSICTMRSCDKDPTYGVCNYDVYSGGECVPVGDGCDEVTNTRVWEGSLADPWCYALYSEERPQRGYCCCVYSTTSTTSTTSSITTTTELPTGCCQCSDGSWMCTDDEFDCSDFCEGTYYADRTCVGDASICSMTECSANENQACDYPPWYSGGECTVNYGCNEDTNTRVDNTGDAWCYELYKDERPQRGWCCCIYAETTTSTTSTTTTSTTTTSTTTTSTTTSSTTSSTTSIIPDCTYKSCDGFNDYGILELPCNCNGDICEGSNSLCCWSDAYCSNNLGDCYSSCSITPLCCQCSDGSWICAEGTSTCGRLCGQLEHGWSGSSFWFGKSCNPSNPGLCAATTTSTTSSTTSTTSSTTSSTTTSTTTSSTTSTVNWYCCTYEDVVTCTTPSYCNLLGGTTGSSCSASSDCPCNPNVRSCEKQVGGGGCKCGIHMCSSTDYCCAASSTCYDVLEDCLDDGQCS
ncbi:MAG: hypothetical protein ACTSPB_13010 [Candidatus Thorarchaeota archaeon]